MQFQAGALAVLIAFSGCVQIERQTIVQEAPAAPAATPAPTPTMVNPEQWAVSPVIMDEYPDLDPYDQIGYLPDGIMGYYSPDGDRYGFLPEGEPYHVIGRRGNSWIWIRLPYVGQFWVVAAQMPHALADWQPEY